MIGCKKLSCISKQNKSNDGISTSHPQKSAAPVPSTSLLIAGIPGTSSNGTPRIETSPGAITPPVDPYRAIKRRLSSALKSANELWKKTQDPYNWQLIKSITMFTLGLKLFNDLHRHMTNESTNCVK
ncbi:uncharacterized protein LOC120631933 [Pararge aegeria]|uniref:uncharacterized protein LOC120631933 n=1 Tax=Pararge aegeria TaxID=116150 RepID=UPI0019CF5F69|nr:uncharacterized protein LOC120631933 [Pararge aegeria]